jgi:lauroyl/myristoyl acyltransferase
MPDLNGTTLRDWVGVCNPSSAEVEELRLVQERALRAAVLGHPVLGESFIERALAYSMFRKTFYEKLLSRERDLGSIPFVVKNAEALLNHLKRGRGVVVVLPRTGFWTSVPVWTGRERIRQTFLFEGAPLELIQLYDSLGLLGIRAESALEICLNDGRSIRIPGSNPLKLALNALEEGMAVGFLGDIYRPKGIPARLLGVNVEVIDHYARVAVRKNAPVLYLRHWTSEEAINLEFLGVGSEQAESRTTRVRSIVQECMRLLEQDLLLRPDQYAYGDDSVFAFSSRP